MKQSNLFDIFKKREYIGEAWYKGIKVFILKKVNDNTLIIKFPNMKYKGGIAYSVKKLDKIKFYGESK